MDNISKDLTQDEHIVKFLESLPLSKKSSEYLEIKTRGQSDDDLWSAVRKGRLTASNHHDIFTKMNRVIKTTGIIKPKTTPLINKIFSTNDITNLDPIEWGKLNEVVALNEFLITEATKHGNFKVNKCGLFLDYKKPYIGASPDAVASCKCHGFCVVEIKCPFNIRDKLLTENDSECSFLELHEMGNIQLKRSHKYYTQVISQIALAKAQLCDFVVLTSKDLIVELTEPNDLHYRNGERSLSIFFRSCICPILLGYKELSFCAKSEKVLLEQNEIEKGQDKIDHNSI